MHVHNDPPNMTALCSRMLMLSADEAKIQKDPEKIRRDVLVGKSG